MAEQYTLQLKAEMEDKLSAKLAPLMSKLEAFEKKAKKPKMLQIGAVDKASKVMNLVQAKMEVMKNKRLNMEIKARTKQAEANLEKLKKLQTIVAKDRTSKVRVDTSTAKAHLKALKQAQNAVKKDIRFKARADVQQAQASMDKLKLAKLALGSKASIPAVLLDMATTGLKKIGGILKGLAKGVTIAVSTAGVRAAKRALDGLGQQQTQSITINRTIQNAGNSKAEARKMGKEYQKYLKDYSMKTPFTPQQMSMFGVKASMMEKGNLSQAKNTTDLMANVKAFVGDLRTEEEVAEAFFSASQGNMEMLNNMLGSQYKTFDEAKKGIAKNQGGLVDELANTLPGRISTLKGIISMGLVDMLSPFQDVLGNALGGVNDKLMTVFTGLSDMIQEHMPQIMDWFGRVGEALSPIGDLFSDMFTNIAEGAPKSQGIFSIFGEAIVLAAQLIGGAIEVCRPIVEGLFNFIGEHAPEITKFLKIMGSVAKFAFKVMWVAAKGAWGILKPILDSMLDLVESIVGAFKGLYDRAKKAWDFLTNHDFDSKASAVGANPYAGLKMATGYNRIPRDNFPARLHAGERVLNRVEADRYERNSGKTVSFGKIADTIVIREEADIDRLMSGFNRQLRIALAGGVA